MDKLGRIFLVSALIFQVFMLYLIGAAIIASSQGVSGASLLLFGFSRTHEIMTILNVTTVITIGMWLMWGISFIRKNK